MNVYHDDNHELVQLFDEVVSTRQPWQFATPCYYLPRSSAPTPIATFVGFKNQPPNINLEMERLQLLYRLEQLCHIKRRPSNQFVSIPHLEPIEPRATPMVIRQETTYQKNTWPIKSIPSQGERSQVPHHRLVSARNQSIGIITYSYCQQVGHMFNHCPFVDDRLKQLLKEEVMNVHQHVLPTIITVVPNVFVLGAQAMNPSI
jgi:hypothetical protein